MKTFSRVQQHEVRLFLSSYYLNMHKKVDINFFLLSCRTLKGMDLQTETKQLQKQRQFKCSQCFVLLKLNCCSQGCGVDHLFNTREPTQVFWVGVPFSTLSEILQNLLPCDSLGCHLEFTRQGHIICLLNPTLFFSH